MCARGAARAAFIQYEDTMATNTTIGPKPISAGDTSCCCCQGRAAGIKAKDAGHHTRKAALREGGLERGRGKQERDIMKRMERENQEEKINEKQMEKVADMMNRNRGTSPSEVGYWVRHAILVLVRVLSAYWQLVSPVFNRDSELRTRIDESRATRGDTIVCVLAVLFLLLLMSVGLWSFRGIIWAGRLLVRIGQNWVA